MSFTAHAITQKFEEEIAAYAGSKYAVAVDSCCNAIFLCLKYLKPDIVSIPKFTYPGVACAVINSGAKVIFKEKDWSGVYKMRLFKSIFESDDNMNDYIVDGALRFKRGMYKGGFHCLSFHIKKHLPIGRGGMILTDDLDAWWWLRKARFDGRNALPLNEDTISMVGWNCYMTPEQAARGLTLFDLVRNKELPDIDMNSQGYPDLSKVEAYK